MPNTSRYSNSVRLLAPIPDYVLNLIAPVDRVEAVRELRHISRIEKQVEREIARGAIYLCK